MLSPCVGVVVEEVERLLLMVLENKEIGRESSV